MSESELEEMIEKMILRKLDPYDDFILEDIELGDSSYGGGKLFRQLTIGGYGRTDLIHVARVDRTLNIDIIELKKYDVDNKAMMQVVKYYTGLMEYLNERNNNINYSVNMIIIGKSIKTSCDSVFIYNLIPNLHYYTYEFCPFNGLMFTDIKKGWVLTNNNFK